MVKDAPASRGEQGGGGVLTGVGVSRVPYFHEGYAKWIEFDVSITYSVLRAGHISEY